MLTIALFEPQIPPNTGNIARLCGATNTKLDVVGEIGFELTDKRLKRAGLDYWKFVQWEYHKELNHYISKLDPNRIHLLTTKSEKPYYETQFNEEDTLIFGSETTGLSEAIRSRFSSRCITIPMANDGIRSLNLSNSVSIVLYEALRQKHFKSIQTCK